MLRRTEGADDNATRGRKRDRPSGATEWGIPGFRGGGTNAARVAAPNAPPEIRGLQFVGGDGRPGNTLGVVAEGYDANGDPVQLEIVWKKNGQPAGTGNLLAAPVKRGDKVTVTVTPFDSKERGKTATLSREIVNTPPAIEGQEQFQVTDNAVTFMFGYPTRTGIH